MHGHMVLIGETQNPTKGDIREAEYILIEARPTAM
jgi:hypothetical protein